MGLPNLAEMLGSVSQALYIPENPYLFARYDSRGRLVGTAARNDPEFRTPVPGGLGGGIQDPGDRVIRAAWLPNSDLLVQILKRTFFLDAATQRNAIPDASYLELFDHSFHLKATGIKFEGFGQLLGAAQDGSLYFNRSSKPLGIFIVKARLNAN